MKKILLLFLILSSYVLFSVEFKYKFNESYRIESTVYENVKFNRKIELSSVILNKYSVNILETAVDSAELRINHHVFQESKGLLAGFYTTHQNTKGDIIQYSNGEMESLTTEGFPAVQNIPYFPDRDIKVGESWTAVATEYFDLNNGFDINDIISTNFRVFYNYSGNKIVDGREMAIINMSYNIYELITPKFDWIDFYPVKISGGSKQVLTWDIEKGRPHTVDDEFFITFTTSDGDLYTFNGRTDSQCWPKNELKSDDMKQLIDKLESTPQTTVVENEDSITITFNSLLFSAESAELKDEVKQYMDSIGSTLKEMGDVNIRILGHTAIFGESDEGYLKDLSTKRARSVAEYLLKYNYLDKNSIEIIGLGGLQPVDTNDTKEGRSRNRRVEIDILKN